MTVGREKDERGTEHLTNQRWLINKLALKVMDLQPLLWIWTWQEVEQRMTMGKSDLAGVVV